MTIPCIVLSALLCLPFATAADSKPGRLMVRVAEIDINPQYLEEYKSILKEESEASVRLEPGVIAIFPMFERENSTKIRILEIYLNREAYEAHLKSPHFIKYKTSTMHMVKALRLVDMESLDEKALSRIFSKMKSN